MKKKLFFVLSLSGLLCFTSCSKEEISPTISVANGNAVITGEVLCNKNTTNDTNEFGVYKLQYENIQSGKIVFHINGKDLQPDPVAGYAYQDITVEASINSDGTYAVELPCRIMDTRVTIKFSDVNDTYTYWENSPTGGLVKKTKEEVFTCNSNLYFISPGDEKKLNFVYQR